MTADMRRMHPPLIDLLDTAENCEFIHALLEQRLVRGEFEVPMLPEVAVRILRLDAEDAPSARRLADIITADPSLAMHVLRVASSAAKRPATPITSLAHAVAWLGIPAVANIAFTLALQGRMLNVPGQFQRARRYWRHALASALWARHLSEMLALDPGEAYLCGLLHQIGKPATLAATYDLALRARSKLADGEYERLVETFHRPVGARLIEAWGLPSIVAEVAGRWEAPANAGPARIVCTLVNLGHRLADIALEDTTQFARDLFADDPAFTELGLEPVDALALFDAAGSIGADLDGYLPA